MTKTEPSAYPFPDWPTAWSAYNAARAATAAARDADAEHARQIAAALTKNATPEQMADARRALALDGVAPLRAIQSAATTYTGRTPAELAAAEGRRCPTCYQTFQAPAELWPHTHEHRPPVRPHPLDQCPPCAAARDALVADAKAAGRWCEPCARLFGAPADLDAHNKTEHKPAEPEPDA